MKTTHKIFIKSIAFLLITIMLSSCYVTMHTVGDGGTYSGKTISEYDVKRKKLYLFSGIPLDDLTVEDVAEGAENYTVRETISFGDVLINSITFGIIGTRTIRVSKSAAEK